ncbi:hypothetical protein [Aquabacterium sp. OR-4]|uniref:hypothetical protein n=1 Tax=Aquabacterium sp. OR-4 TaxID=2978127 RepID=UPI0021B459DD|nr:hypothetical protein [Aquabacterium sp. OR-4]MDT7834354.1 hypothetical protein [Aquabacterium sp. OR-4]
MACPATIIPIHAAEPSRGCAACLQASSGPVCRSALGEPCGAPRLSGPAAELHRVMQALQQSLGLPISGDDNRVVRALTLGDGEAELQLAVDPRCGGAELADTAFQTLRRLLPDTDIYVTHHA